MPRGAWPARAALVPSLRGATRAGRAGDPKRGTLLSPVPRLWPSPIRQVAIGCTCPRTKGGPGEGRSISVLPASTRTCCYRRATCPASTASASRSKSNDARSTSRRFPPVGLRAKTLQKDLFLSIDVAAVERDSDHDGLTDLLEEKLVLDPRCRARWPAHFCSPVAMPPSWSWSPWTRRDGLSRGRARCSVRRRRC
jgi:hypothetical protein